MFKLEGVLFSFLNKVNYYICLLCTILLFYFVLYYIIINYFIMQLYNSWDWVKNQKIFFQKFKIALTSF